MPKHEVRRPLDQTLAVQLVALLREHRILEARKRTAVVPAVRIRRQRDGLLSLAEAVVDVDVVEAEVGRLDAQRARRVIAGFPGQALAGGDGHRVARVPARVARRPIDGQLRRAWRHEHLLFVGARADEDALRGLGGDREGVDSGLYRAVGAACFADGETAWRGAGTAGGQDRSSRPGKQEKQEAEHTGGGGVGDGPGLQKEDEGLREWRLAYQSNEALHLPFCTDPSLPAATGPERPGLHEIFYYLTRSAYI